MRLVACSQCCDIKILPAVTNKQTKKYVKITECSLCLCVMKSKIHSNNTRLDPISQRVSRATHS